jgi:cleavage stimulation factor subunit 2
VYDRDTGRPKGFGFAEYADPEIAASAVRNLNDYETMGRKLRVDFSHEGGDEDAAPSGYVPQPPMPPNGTGLPPVQSTAQPSTLPPLPPGVDLPPNLTCPDAISRTLSTLPAPQLLDILSQMKGLVMADPSKATELLKQAPQLSYAIFQALLLMGLVDTSVLSSVIEQTVPPAQPASQPITVQPVPPPPQQAAYQPFLPTQLPAQVQVPTPPLHTQPYAPPPPQQPVQPPVPQQPQQQPVGMDKAALIQQVLSLTPEQIAALPPAEQGQIILLRQQLMAGGGF